MYDACAASFVALTKEIKIHSGYPNFHVANRFGQPVLDGYTRDPGQS